MVRQPVLDLPTGVLVYTIAVGAAFLGLWMYYDRRDHRRFEQERRRVSFHCIRCDALYTGPAGTVVMHCPACAKENGRLRF